VAGTESETLAAFRATYLVNHEAFNRQDIEGAFGGLPADVEWRTLTEIPGAPDLCRGRDEVIAFFREVLIEYPDWQTELLAFEEPDPGVVLVEFRARATGRASGIRTTSAKMFQAWDLREPPVRVTEFATRDAAAEHFGWPTRGG
jgi:hypothetical protein